MKKGLFDSLDFDLGMHAFHRANALTGYGGPITATFDQTSQTIQIDKHIDWFKSTSDTWQDGALNGGVFVYKGGSLDVHITLAPTGTTTTFDLQNFSGWSVYVNGPNSNSSVSHSESTGVVKQHSTWQGGESDTIVFRKDMFDHQNSNVDGVLNDQQHSTHYQSVNQHWINPMQQGSQHQIVFEEHEQETHTDAYGYSVQHNMDSSFHQTETVLIGFVPDNGYHDGKG